MHVARPHRTCRGGSHGGPRNVAIDRKQLEALCESTLDETTFEGLGERIQGKVRDSYLDPEHRPGRRTMIS